MPNDCYGFHPQSPAELAHTDAGRMLDVALSTIAVSRMGTLIAPANPMIVSTKASMMAPPRPIVRSRDEIYAEGGRFDNRPDPATCVLR